MESDPPSVQNNIKNNTIPNTQPEVIIKPHVPFFLKSKIFIPFIVILILILVTILLNYTGILPLSFLPSKKQLIVEVNGEKIYKKEVESAQGLFSYLRGQEWNQPNIQKEALDFVIDSRLLAKEAQKRGINVSDIVQKRFLASITQFGNENELQKATNTDIETYKNYLTDQTIRETFIPIDTQWREVDYLSIRYIWNDKIGPEEASFKEIAFKKAQEYHGRITNGVDIREAIKLRCQDREIDYYPFEDHYQVYSKTFDGNICREQRLNFKLSKENNPDWEDLLKEVFKYHKGDITPVIPYQKQPSLGMYFILKILDEGPGQTFSINDLIENLRKAANIKVYEQ